MIISVVYSFISCKRLQLEPLAYLWHRDQSVLLQDMINDKLTAVLIKVASIGKCCCLFTYCLFVYLFCYLFLGLSQKDLGKTLQEMQPQLQSLVIINTGSQFFE